MSTFMLPLVLRDWCSEEKMKPLEKADLKIKSSRYWTRDVAISRTAFSTLQIAILNAEKVPFSSSGDEGGSTTFWQEQGLWSQTLLGSNFSFPTSCGIAGTHTLSLSLLIFQMRKITSVFEVVFPELAIIYVKV
uniref:Uncharacterized protein n=1 Tax=Molossus molossus TaxID=27622 RepID=A0A7J8GRQ1_MOLMO|nr:hypothetical protein HJG59_011325 [Molossus molossus]